MNYFFVSLYLKCVVSSDGITVDQCPIGTILLAAFHFDVFPECLLFEHPLMKFARSAAHRVLRTSVVTGEIAVERNPAVKDYFAHADAELEFGMLCN